MNGLRRRTSQNQSRCPWWPLNKIKLKRGGEIYVLQWITFVIFLRLCENTCAVWVIENDSTKLIFYSGNWYLLREVAQNWSGLFQRTFDRDGQMVRLLWSKLKEKDQSYTITAQNTTFQNLWDATAHTTQKVGRPLVGHKYPAIATLYPSVVSFW